MWEAEFIQGLYQVLPLERHPPVLGDILGHVAGNEANELGDQLLHQLDGLAVYGYRGALRLLLLVVVLDEGIFILALYLPRRRRHPG